MFDNTPYIFAIDPDMLQPAGPVNKTPATPGMAIPYKPGDPIDFDTYIGQARAKKIIQLHLDAMIPGEQLKVLFSAPAGIGKTAFARVVAKEMQKRKLITNYFEIVAGKIESKPLLDRFIARIPANSLVFIDEIHGLKGSARDAMLPVLADNLYAYDFDGETMKQLPKGISWIGCTTDIGKLPTAVQRRFQVINLEPMTLLDRVFLASTQPMEVSEKAAVKMAECSWTPWEVKDEVYVTARNIAINNNRGNIILADAVEALNLLGIDRRGLRQLDRNTLCLLASHPRLVKGRTRYGMSANAIIVTTGVDKQTFYNKIEPKLLAMGLTTVSPGIGRELTEKGLEVVNEIKREIIHTNRTT